MLSEETLETKVIRYQPAAVQLSQRVSEAPLALTGNPGVHHPIHHPREETRRSKQERVREDAGD